MTPAPPRTASQRKTDALAQLQADAADVWVATASVEDGTLQPHLVPVSLAWVADERLVIAIQNASRTARALLAHRTARLGVGPTRTW